MFLPVWQASSEQINAAWSRQAAPTFTIKTEVSVMADRKNNPGDENAVFFGVNKDGTTFPVIFDDDHGGTKQERGVLGFELLQRLVRENPRRSRDAIQDVFIAQVEVDPVHLREALEFYFDSVHASVS
jgi:hypothetical protein